MTTILQANEHPATGNRQEKRASDQLITDFIQQLEQQDPLTLDESVAQDLVDRWLRLGQKLHHLPARLKQEPAPKAWQNKGPKNIWFQEIDYLFAHRTCRRLQRDRLQHEVGRLVAELNQKNFDPGIYQQLVKLGFECRHDLPAFRRCLRQAKLEKTRISEITRIAQCPNTARQFIAGTMSVRRALFEARSNSTKGGRPKQKEAKTTWEILGDEAKWAEHTKALLEQLLAMQAARHAAAPWPIQVGLYQLSYTPAPPAPPQTPSEAVTVS